ncbi:MAG: flagellin lysine-N-methylase [Rickettsiales bacterium]
MATQRFTCLGDACEDTCCKGWGMQLTQETVNLYQTKAPELMQSVTSGEAEFIMKRDEKTDYCVEFQAGWCGVHKKYGSDYLGDACHFFPRSTRALGDITVMTMALSCPEATRLMLTEDGAHSYSTTTFERVPHSLRNYAPQELSPEAALKIHEACVAEMGNDAFSAERNFMRLSAMVRGLEPQPKDQWEAAVPFYFRMAEGRIPSAELKATDPFMLLNALQGLVHSAPASPRERLMNVINMMARALGVTLNWEKLILDLHPDGTERVVNMQAWWREHGAQYQPILRRYLQAQLRLNLFPFAGLGKTLSERITIIGVRFATVKLALMAACFEAQGAIPETEVVRIVQSLSRFQDHLADSQLSLSIYEETGWTREARLRALVGDV